MALSHVQSVNSMVIATGSPLTSILTFPTTVTSGNAIIVQVTQQGSSTRTFTCSDDVDGAYTTLKDASDFVPGEQNKTWIFYKENHTGGTVTITVTHSNSSADFAATAAEYAGFGSAISVAANDKLTDPSTATTHAASPEGVSHGGDCLAIVQGSTSGPNFTDSVAGTGYTKIPSGYSNTDYYFAYQIYASGVTADTGQWTSTGAARQCTTIIYLLIAASAPESSGGVAITFIGF